MSDQSNLTLTPYAERLVESACLRKSSAQDSYLGLHHWLVTLIECYPTLVEALANGVQVQTLRRKLLEHLKCHEPGPRQDKADLLQKASTRAAARGALELSERDLAATLLIIAGYEMRDSASTLPVVQMPQSIRPGASTYASNAAASSPSAGRQAVPVRKASASALEQYGRDLIQEARQHKLVKVLGREEEIQIVIETLCRRTKRNPVLVGPAGVGKTAIAEGLAYHIIEGSVPNLLKNARIIALHPSSLTAGASMAGEVEKRMKAVIAEASQEDVILFIDEIHTIMGAGGIPGATDIASILKPALARGDIACVAATTDEEYRRFIENDSALERRFQPIRVHEISAEVTLDILSAICRELGDRHSIEVEPPVLPFLIGFASQFMHNRHFPDKGVDLIEQCFAHSILKGQVTIDLGSAQEVAQRMVGMPLALEKRLDGLSSAMLHDGLLPASAVSQLINRLQVTLRGLDLRSSRPNAVLLLSGDAAARSDLLAKTIAQHLYGSEERVITIDFSRMWHAEDINLLVGSPPGYVGYTDSLPLHRLAQTPWCVLRFENIDACHPTIREMLAQGFYDGWIMDGRGRPIHLSDTVVILSADVSVQNRHTTGFLTSVVEAGEEDARRAVSAALGPDLAERIDLFIYRMEGEADLSVKWLEEHLTADLTRRYLKQGVSVKWDESTLKWLLVQYKENWSSRDWEKWVDTELTPHLISHLPARADDSPQQVTIKMAGDKITVEDAAA